MKTEYVWGVVSGILLGYSIVKQDIIFIIANTGFLIFNIYQLLRNKKKKVTLVCVGCKRKIDYRDIYSNSPILCKECFKRKYKK